MGNRAAGTLVLVLLLASIPSRAAWRDAFNQAKDFVIDKGRDAVQKTGDIVRQGNPKAAILNALKPPDGLSRAVGQVGTTLASLKSAASADVLPYTKLKSQWRTNKKVKTIDPAILALLDQPTLKQTAYRIGLDGRRYYFYDTGALLFPFDPDSPSLSLDTRLETVVEAGVTRCYSRGLNARYFKRLDRLASASTKTSRAIEEAANIALEFIAKIYSTSIMGVGAVQIVDPLVTAASGGLSLDQIRTTLTQLRDGAGAVRAVAEQIAAGTGQVRTGLAACKRNEGAAADIVRTADGMQSIGHQLGALAQPFGGFRRDLDQVRSGIDRLQSFTQLAAIQYATRAVNKVDESAAKIETGINNYASSFTGFAGRVDAETGQWAGKVREHFVPRLERMAGPLEREGDSLMAAHSLLMETGGRWATGESSYAAFDRYSVSIGSLVASSKQARQTDVVLALDSIAKLDQHLAAAPFASFGELCTTLTGRIAADQVLGAPDTALLLTRIASMGHGARAARIEQLGGVAADLRDLESSVSRANFRLYVISGAAALLCVGGGVVGLILWRKRRNGLALRYAAEETGA